MPNSTYRTAGQRITKDVNLSPHIYGSDLENTIGYSPQFMSIRSNNRNIIWVDSRDRENPTQTNMGEFIISRQLTSSNIKRLMLAFISFEWNVPNVNIGNNTITFFSTTSATTHTVTVAEGFYDHVNLIPFATAIQTALNTATGASGLTWTVTPRANDIPIIDFSTAGGSFHFTGGSMYDYGRSLINLPNTTTSTTTKSAGWINMMWTRYLIIRSSALTRTKSILNSSSSFDPSDFLEFVVVPRERQSIPNTFQVIVQIEGAINMVGNTMSAIDFAVEDEYGRNVGYLFESPNPEQSNGDFIQVFVGEL